MDLTHATEGGGVRSRARLEIGKAVEYSDVWVAGVEDKISGTRLTRKDFHSSSAALNVRLSANDAEVYAIDQVESKWRAKLQNLPIGGTAKLEFHGNHGPCNGCKKRIKDLLDRLQSYVPKDASLEAAVYYSVKGEPHTKGDVEDFYGYQKDEEGVGIFTEAAVKYGSSIKPTTLDRFQFLKMTGKAARPKKLAPSPPPQNSPSSNMFDALAEM